MNKVRHFLESRLESLPQSADHSLLWDSRALVLALGHIKLWCLLWDTQNFGACSGTHRTLVLALGHIELWYLL